jgi:hypothetical protein
MFLSPAQATAEAWVCSYVHRGQTYTYPTRYATKQEAINAFTAWKRDRSSFDKNPPQFRGVIYLPNDRPDPNRRPY